MAFAILVRESPSVLAVTKFVTTTTFGGDEVAATAFVGSGGMTTDALVSDWSSCAVILTSVFASSRSRFIFHQLDKNHAANDRTASKNTISRKIGRKLLFPD